jgi:hypothetical protein
MDTKMMEEARRYADMFNRAIAGIDAYKQYVIHFPAWVHTGVVTQVPRDTRFHGIRVGEKVMIEPALVEQFMMFNSNYGYESGHDIVPHAFTHWFFEQSEHRSMICDLQGVRDVLPPPAAKRVYFLTDPAIHTADSRYRGSKTDLGVPGMVMVMLYHKCNDLCRRLGLEPLPKGVARPPFRARMGTTFTFNLTPDELNEAVRLWFLLNPRARGRPR